MKNTEVGMQCFVASRYLIHILYVLSVLWLVTESNNVCDVLELNNEQYSNISLDKDPNFVSY